MFLFLPPVDKANYKTSEGSRTLKETLQIDRRNVKVTCTVMFYSDRTIPQIKNVCEGSRHYSSVLRKPLKDNGHGNYISHDLYGYT